MPWTVADVDRFKKGLTPAQKRRWVEIANSALQSCQARGGSNCEASAIRQANGVVGHVLTLIEVNSEYEVRVEQVNNVRYLVVPVVMMVEGVHNGSLGPLLHLAEDLGQNPHLWNGRPVVINHPEDSDGNYISANSPNVTSVGVIYNTRMDGNRLRAEAWLEEDKLGQISVETLQRIMQQAPLEVSVGVFTDEERITGTWNNEAYEAIARNHRPDHLALLPNAIGACSIDDGCGVRVNKNDWTSNETFEPPEAGNAPAAVKSILQRVYNDCRTRWVRAHPSDRENSANKTSCSRIAWHAVEQAGWHKQGERWVMAHEEKGGNMNEALVINALSYSGTESTAWSAPTLGDFGVSGNWETLSATERSRVASHYLIGSSGAATFAELKLPVVNPRTGKLNERALRAVIGGRGAAVGGVSAEAKSAARRRAYRLLNSEFNAGLTIPEGLEEAKLLNMDGFAVNMIGNADPGYKELVENIQRKLDRMDNPSAIHFLEEVYDSDFIYRVSNSEGTKYYRRTYSANDGTIEFTGEPVEVRKKTEFINMVENNGTHKRTKFNSNKEDGNMSDQKKTPCCEDLVNELITNERTKFTEENREWLNTLEEDQLALLVPNEEKPKDKKEPTKDVQADTDKDKEPKKPLTIDDMPVEMRDQLRAGLKLFNKQRENMIQVILDNTEKDVWTKDVLETMQMDTLERVFNSVKKEDVDYSVMVVGNNKVAIHERKPLRIPSMSVKKDDKKEE